MLALFKKKCLFQRLLCVEGEKCEYDLFSESKNTHNDKVQNDKVYNIGKM